jgi:hypothetical protein
MENVNSNKYRIVVAGTNGSSGYGQFADAAAVAAWIKAEGEWRAISSTHERLWHRANLHDVEIYERMGLSVDDDGRVFRAYVLSPTLSAVRVRAGQEAEAHLI